jgi:hypothetical protein
MLPFHKLEKAFSSRNELNLSFDMCHQIETSKPYGVLFASSV